MFRFYYQPNLRYHIGDKEFKEINWIAAKVRAEQHVAINVFKYWDCTSPFYVNELFVPCYIHINRSHWRLEYL